MKLAPLLLALAAALPAAAAEVDVRFNAPEKFRDAGRDRSDRERSTAAIAGIFRTLGAALPQGQTLRVEVKDLDLAGELKYTPRGDVRVLRDGADWPHIDFAWSLEADGRVLRQGVESLAGSADSRRQAPRDDRTDLPHEKRMLERWFAQRFDTTRPQ